MSYEAPGGSERSPLLGQSEEPSGLNNAASGEEIDPPLEGTAPPPYSESQNVQEATRLPVGLDEMPPPYTPSAPGSAPVINCKVCQATISLEGKQHLHVVKCQLCNEATPIRAAPPGRKYIRCPCNLLLVCRAGATKILCPRESCKRVISLPGQATFAAGGGRYICAYCNQQFVFRLAFRFARCPHCRRVSSILPGYSRVRGHMFLFIGIIFLAAATGITVGTYEMAAESGGIYVAWIGGFIAGIVFLLRAVLYYSMRTSMPAEPSV